MESAKGEVGYLRVRKLKPSAGLAFWSVVGLQYDSISGNYLGSCQLPPLVPSNAANGRVDRV